MAIPAEVYLASSTGVRSTHVPTASVDSVTYKLNDIDTAKVSIHPLEADASLITLNNMELALVLGGNFNNNFAGVPRFVSGNTSGITFDIEDPISYALDWYVIDSDRVYSGVEQMNIATDLVTYGQGLGTPSFTNGNRAISIGSYSGSGVTRDRTYLAEEYHNVFELLQAFPNLDNGFDWDVVIASDGTRRFTPFYPNKGSLKASYPMTLDKAGMSDYLAGLSSWSEDGTALATDVIVTGPQDATTSLKLRGRYQAGTGGGQPMAVYGRVQRVVAESSDVTLAWLNAKATSIGLASVTPRVLPKFPISDELFGVVTVGDTVPVRIDYGRIQVSGNYRIMELTVKPAESVMDATLQAL